MPKQKKETIRKLSPYNLFMKSVLQSLKQSHGTVSYGHRFKAAAHLWTQRLELTANDIAAKTNCVASKIPKSLLQQKAWEGSQRDMQAILEELGRAAVKNARIEAEAGDTEADVSRATTEYNRHMQHTLARLKVEHPEQPYQARFKLAASLWQQDKKQKQNKNKDKVVDKPLYTNQSMSITSKQSYSLEDNDFLLQGPSSSMHQQRIPMGFYTGEMTSLEDEHTVYPFELQGVQGVQAVQPLQPLESLQPLQPLQPLPTFPTLSTLPTLPILPPTDNDNIFHPQEYFYDL